MYAMNNTQMFWAPMKSHVKLFVIHLYGRQQTGQNIVSLAWQSLQKPLRYHCMGEELVLLCHRNDDNYERPQLQPPTQHHSHLSSTKLTSERKITTGLPLRPNP
eukprot:768187-Hanusia_phi.AAC.2